MTKGSIAGQPAGLDGFVDFNGLTYFGATHRQTSVIAFYHQAVPLKVFYRGILSQTLLTQASARFKLESNRVEFGPKLLTFIWNSDQQGEKEEDTYRLLESESWTQMLLAFY